MDQELIHHGIKGMHWGVRRFQENRGNKKIKKLGSKIADDEKRISDLQKRKAKYAQKSVKYQEKGEKINTKIPFGWDIQTARRDKAYVKSGKLEAKSKRLEKRIEESETNIQKNREKITKINERIHSNYNKPIKSLNANTIKNGEQFLKELEEI